MNTIEEKLWSYIDGSCSAEEQRAMKVLIEQDEVYRKKYDELMAFNQELSSMEADEPPMAFTYHVMEAIRTEHAQQPLRAAIDKRIILGLSGFFIFTILAILIYGLATANWSTNHQELQLSNNLTKDVQTFVTGHALKGFLFFDVVLGLFLFDAYLRKKNLRESTIRNSK